MVQQARPSGAGRRARPDLVAVDPHEAVHAPRREPCASHDAALRVHDRRRVPLPAVHQRAAAPLAPVGGHEPGATASGVVTALAPPAPARTAPSSRQPRRGVAGSYFSPRARAKSSRPIFERPSSPRRRAILMSSARVFGDLAPVRLRLRTADACLPKAVRVRLGMCAIVFLRLAALIAFRT